MGSGGGNDMGFERIRGFGCLCYHLVQVMHDKDEHVPASS